MSNYAFKSALDVLKTSGKGKQETMFSDMNALSEKSWDSSDGLVYAFVGGVKITMIIDSGATVRYLTRGLQQVVAERCSSL